MAIPFFDYATLARECWRYGDTREGVSKPWPLVLHDRCREWRTLPNGGGVLDQSEQVMRLMSHCAYVRYLQQLPLVDYEGMDGDTFFYIQRIKEAADG